MRIYSVLFSVLFYLQCLITLYGTLFVLNAVYAFYTKSLSWHDTVSIPDISIQMNLVSMPVCRPASLASSIMFPPGRLDAQLVQFCILCKLSYFFPYYAFINNGRYLQIPLYNVIGHMPRSIYHCLEYNIFKVLQDSLSCWLPPTVVCRLSRYV